MTCSDPQFISDSWWELGLREPMRFTLLLLSSVRIRSLTSWPVSKVWRKTRHLTNGGVLKILCLDIEELLDKILVDSLNKYFCQWQREV